MRKLALVSLVVLVPGLAVAQGRPVASAKGVSSAAAPAESASARAMPSGHPPLDDESPHGHGAPHGDHGAGGREPPQNVASDDPTLPRGTTIVEVRTPDETPFPDQAVTLGIVEQSVAKGESRRRFTQTTDATGRTTFAIPDVTSDMAFRISLVRDGATSAAPPFRTPSSGGSRVILYAFPAVRDVRAAQIAAQGLVYLEPRDEVIQIEGAYRLYNLALTSWVPTDVAITLPAGFKAFNGQKSMDDLTWDGTKTGATFHGTVPPGLHDSAYRFQVPNDGDSEIVADIGLLPNVQSMRVIAEAPKGATLEVDGFPPAITTTNQQGQRILVTEKTTDRMDPSFRTLHVRLGGLPTHSRGRLWAALLAAFAVLGGLYAAITLRDRRHLVAEPAEIEQAKALLLDELARLEAVHDRGEIGPKTYARTREELLDALARLIAEDVGPRGTKTSLAPNH